MADHWTHHDGAVRELIARAVAEERERIARAIEARRDDLRPQYRGLAGRVLWPSMNLIYEDAARIARGTTEGEPDA